MSKATQTLGQKGEEAALRHYEQKGFKLVEKNWRTRYGEIDLIVRKKRLIVLIEVKSFQEDSPIRGIENLTQRKRERLRRLAEFYLAGLPERFRKCEIGFDLAEVAENGGRFEVRIWENILAD